MPTTDKDIIFTVDIERKLHFEQAVRSHRHRSDDSAVLKNI
jgi:hypothetical protein